MHYSVSFILYCSPNFLLCFLKCKFPLARFSRKIHAFLLVFFSKIVFYQSKLAIRLLLPSASLSLSFHTCKASPPSPSPIPTLSHPASHRLTSHVPSARYTLSHSISTPAAWSLFHSLSPSVLSHPSTTWYAVPSPLSPLPLLTYSKPARVFTSFDLLQHMKTCKRRQYRIRCKFSWWNHY